MWKRVGLLVLTASITVLLIAVAAVGVFRSVRGHADKVPESENASACATEVAAISDAHTAFEYGDSYFGGEQGYDLACARAGYARAIEIDPQGHPLVWHQYGRTDFLVGDFHNAIFKFEKQIEYFGDALPNVHYMLGLTYGYLARETKAADDWARAEAEFRTYLEFDPVSPWARTDLSWVLFSEGKYEDMKPVIEEGLLVQPRHPWLLNMYGLALLNTGDREGARLFFTSALEQARALTVESWGMAYPGNDPEAWPIGLEEMRKTIQENLNIATSRE